MALATTYVPSLLLCVAHTRFRGSKRSELVIRRGNLKQTSGCQQERDCKESELQEDESMNVDQKMNHKRQIGGPFRLRIGLTWIPV
ncbi:hypothetical protein NC652_005373 [Populus alba x Populus x berolinensis]|nr:hypothetical protein NC652_005373 [Populus alba x Populus x berolinensis]